MQSCDGIVGILLILAICISVPAAAQRSNAPQATVASGAPEPYIVVLGVAQDGGYPHAGCRRACCEAAWGDASLRRGVACVAIVDPVSGQRWIIDATPDFPEQLRALDDLAPLATQAGATGAGAAPGPGLAGILLTHAHIGHYTGLMHLGREVLGARGVPVYAMPRMREFLAKHGPWDQLVRLGNIELRPLAAGQPVALNERLTATPIVVPHRDEYSETVGFRIAGPRRSVLYVCDTDKWEEWSAPIETLLGQVDVAYLDGTFYAEGELPGRSMAEIPHPFIQESLRRFAPLAPEERAKIRFIHLNHTNPALRAGGEARRQIERAGLRVAEVGERTPL